MIDRSTLRYFWRDAATSLLIATMFILPVGAPLQSMAQAATAPGTVITNNATATFKDSNGVSYNTTSNTVTTVVQNAPTITEVPGTGTDYSPGALITDNFTITNTGNATGTFTLSGTNTTGANGQFTSTSSDATIGGNNASFATLGGGPSSSAGCGSGPAIYAITINSTTTYCSQMVNVNSFLSGQAIPANGQIFVVVYYQMASGGENTTTGSNSVSSTLYSTLSYAAVGSAAAEVSAVASGTETNFIVNQAVINEYKLATQCTSLPCTPSNDNLGDIQFTISASNSSTIAAKDLQSVKALIGSAWPSGGGNGGVLLSDKVPQFNGTPLTLSNVTSSAYHLSIVTSTTNGFATGASAYLVYSTSSTGATWALASGSAVTGSATGAFTIPTSVGSIYYVGLLIVGGSCASNSGYELCTDPSSTTNGNSNVASSAAVQYSYTVVQPTGAGSANTCTVADIGDAMWGDAQVPEHILGPNVPVNTTDSTSSAALTASNQGINYTTSTLIFAASNPTCNSSIATFGVLNGPYDPNDPTYKGAAATGSYDGSVALTNNNDFTAVGFSNASDQVVNSSTTAGTPATTTTLGAVQTLCIKHTLYNNGNKNDTYQIVANQSQGFAIPSTSGGSALSGSSVGIYSDSACTVALGGSAQNAPTSTASSVNVTSGTGIQYYVKYILPVGTKYFYRYDGVITATSNGNNTLSNNTHDELYSGLIALTKSANITSTGCPAGVTPTLPTTSGSGAQVCPGGVINYSVDYRNLVMGTSSTNVSFNQCFTQAGTFTLNDDGTSATGSNDWATYTTGLQSLPTDNDSNSTIRSGANASVYGFWTNNPATGSSSATFTAGATRFSDVVGGSSFQLAPKGYFTSGIVGDPTLPLSEPTALDWQGNASFSVTVK